MLNQKLFEDLQAKLSEVLAHSPAKDIERNLKAALSAFFARLDLVTREEFDVQRQVLLRTREKLDQLERRVAKLDGRQPQAGASPEGVNPDPGTGSDAG